ncbi:MAG: hypothetical protein PWR27_637 [Petroclostridium sp.]|jgi:uncharacterized protein YlxW (UPF0749 family)|uniref:DUF881 domain-containing protein n=1 Tax=Petroclostridium xylanilyticum TaxID=1792311 RepID=UPI000B988EED|nr:DUF881 domain-containing protein [Petroclostridium xylanilyticum]MBZ4644979.1 hypothetical protein [Clostridia bacterium]MDK2809928.1 hypothetical protein [Petroclostridium sp.]
MKNIRAQIAIAFICIILGFMISIQFKSVKRNFSLVSKQFQRADELQLELKKEQEKNENLYKQLLQYEKDLNAYQKEAAQRSDYANALLDQLKRAEILAGLTDVEGPGVIITLNDSKLKNDSSNQVDENYFIIHDEDILMVINELADAGAEAISLNDERLIATSEIRCAGATVSVNNNRHSTPFIIKAIGDPDTLEAALNLRGGVRDILGQWGIEFNVKKSNKILVPRYNGVINFKYAVPVKKEGK